VAAAATSASPAASAPAAQSAATGTAAAKAVTPEEQFGYGAGAMARADTDQKKEEAAKTALNEIVATVTQVSTRQRGEFVVTLDNGQVWAQKAPESNVRVKVGDQVRIKSGALNSYMLSLTRSDRTTRVTRVR
jgi:transcription antitermination factor NusG